MKNRNDISATHPVSDLSPVFTNTKSCSSMDCTGSVPTPPQTSSELDSYLEVYDFLPHHALTKPNDVEIDMFAAEKRRK